MSASQMPLASRSRLRLPRRTARFRLTALYSGLFLLSGVALLAATYALFERATKYKLPRLPKIPHTPSLQNLLPLPKGASINLFQHPHQLALAQRQLAQALFLLKGVPKSPAPIAFNVGPLQNLLTSAQRQLASAEHQLVKAVHQIARSGSVQAAQRAADSHQLLVNSGVALAIVAVLALLTGWFVSGRMLRPIRTITRTARRISSTNLHERLALIGPEDELKELGDTLDELFARLDASFGAQRQFVANASHELRTPITVERTLLQVALDSPDMTVAEWRSTASEVLACCEEQARLIDGLLTLASSEGGLVHSQKVDLAAIVSATLVELQAEIIRRKIHVEVETAAAPLDGDPVLLERLVVNLLDNAIRHNTTDGHVKIESGVKDERAVLSVTNTGPPIDPLAVERLFLPFQRIDPRRTIYENGHGLGLSIVRATVDAHQARIVAQALPDGGLSVKVAFPLTANVIRHPESSATDR